MVNEFFKKVLSIPDTIKNMTQFGVPISSQNLRNTCEVYIVYCVAHVAYLFTVFITNDIINLLKYVTYWNF
jgi:hypothetical protein